MGITKKSTDRQSPVAALVVAALLIWGLQRFVPYGRLVLYPFTLLSTWVHEMGHGLTALFLGGRFERLDIYADASGLAYSYVLPGARGALVAAGGLLAPPFVGMAMLMFGRRAARPLLMGLATAMVVSLALWVSELGVYPGALALAAQGVTCGGAKSNRRAYKDRLAVEGPLSPAYEELIFDPQTSGGLLCALPAADAEAALGALRGAGVAACRIGEVRPRATAALIVYGDAGACR